MRHWIQKIRAWDWGLLQHLGLLGFIGFFGPPAFLWFFAFSFFGLYRMLRGTEQEESNGGNRRPYYRSLLLSQMNPFTMVQGTSQQFGHLAILLRYRGQLPDAKSFEPQVAYRLPFRGTWRVANGGISQQDSHSWDILTQRYAYDFLMVDEAGKSYRGDGQRLEDYYCYGQDILAPADGCVLQLKDSIPDHQQPGDSSIDWSVRDFRGNFIVLKHAQGEYTFLAHFQPGSLQVKKGNTVKQGQLLGRCGNSGHSTEPHLHIHLQDHPNFYLGMGLPLPFEQMVAQAEGQPDESARTEGFVREGELVGNG